MFVAFIQAWLQLSPQIDSLCLRTMIPRKIDLDVIPRTSLQHESNLLHHFKVRAKLLEFSLPVG